MNKLSVKVPGVCNCDEQEKRVDSSPKPAEFEACRPDIPASWESVLNCPYPDLVNILGAELLSVQTDTARAQMKKKGAESTVEALRAMVEGLGPQDLAETLAAVQAVGAHRLALHCMARATAAGPAALKYGRLANSFIRSFAILLDSLSARQGKGRRSEQRVVVEHVSVGSESQVLIGPVDREGGGGS